MHVSYAEDISVEVTVDRKSVVIGSILQLSVTIKGVEESAPLKLPKFVGFDSDYLGPSTQIRIVNGQYSKTVVYTYILKPLGVGKFTIPSLDIDLSGKTYTSGPITIEVVESSADLPAPLGGGKTENLENKIFLVLETSKKEYYLHEQIPVTLKLYVQDLSVRDIEYPELSNIGFSSEDYRKPVQYTQVVGGLQYRVVEFGTNLYSTRTGKLNLGPAKVKGNVLIPNAKRIRRKRGGSIFEDTFFDDFFSSVQRQSVMISSLEMPVTILPLPETNKPIDFSGGVGQYDFNVTASPSDVSVGDPITIRITISGEGDLKAVSLPSLKEGDHFKVYEPQTKQEEKTKILEQVLIPRSDQVTQVPAISFSYFDPNDKKYVTTTRGPFPLTVSPLKEASEFKIIDLSGGGMTYLPETLGRDLIYLKGEIGAIRPLHYAFYKSKVFKVLLLLLTLIFTGGYYAQGRILEVKSDVALARRLRAPRKAKKALTEAKSLFVANNFAECYDLLARTVKDYFGDKFHLPSSGLTYQELKKTLDTKNISDEEKNKVKELFETFDEARFTSLTITAEAAKSSIGKSEELIDYFERSA